LRRKGKSKQGLKPKKGKKREKKSCVMGRLKYAGGREKVCGQDGIKRLQASRRNVRAQTKIITPSKQIMNGKRRSGFGLGRSAF